MGCILILKWKSSVLHSDWINGRLNDSCMLRRGGLWANEEPLYLLCNVFDNAFELHLAVQLCPELTSKRRGFFCASYFLSKEVVLLLDDSTPT